MAEKVNIKAFFMDFCPSDGAYFCQVFGFLGKSLFMPWGPPAASGQNIHPCFVHFLKFASFVFANFAYDRWA